MSNACEQQACSKDYAIFEACARLLHVELHVPVMPIVSSSKTCCPCCSGPSEQRVASGCTMVYAVLTAVLEWANYPPVISASVDCLKTTLHYLNTGAVLSSYTGLAHTHHHVASHHKVVFMLLQSQKRSWVQPDNDSPRHMRLYMQNELHDTHNKMSHASANVCWLIIQFSCYS